MRHGKKFNHLSRQAPHRKAMLANMACSLIEHKKVNTTVAKAKALRKFVEPLITKSKTDSTHSRRVVFSYLRSKEAVTELFRDVAVKVADRPGGYTRILKTGFRLGDNAKMCFIELVDYNENMLKDAKAKKTSRRRRGGSKKADDTVATAPVEDTAVEVTEANIKAEVIEEPVAEVVEEAKVEDAVETVEEAPVKEVKAETTEDAATEQAVEEKVEEVAPEAKAEETPEDAKKEDKSDEEDKKEE